MGSKGDLIYWGTEQIFCTKHFQYFLYQIFANKYFNPLLNIFLTLNPCWMLFVICGQFSPPLLRCFPLETWSMFLNTKLVFFLYIFWICIWYLRQGRDWYSLLKHHVDWFILRIFPSFSPSPVSLGSFALNI